MHCPKCNKRMKKQLWGFCYYYVCEYCGHIILTSDSEDKPIDYNFPRFERSELIDTSQTQIFK